MTENKDDLGLSVEQARLEIERLLLESGLKERVAQYDIDLKKLELEIAKEKRKGSFLQKGFLVAFLGVIATISASLIQGYNSLLLERQKLQSNLIQQATDTDDRSVSKNNLRFLLELGLIDNDKLRSLIGDDDTPIRIPARRELVSNREFSVSNLQSPFAVKGQFSGEWSASPEQVFVAFSRSVITYPEVNPAGDPEQWISFIRIGLAETFDQSWDIVAESEDFSVDQAVVAGSELSLPPFSLSFKLPDRQELINRWLVVSIGIQSGADSLGVSLVPFAQIRASDIDSTVVTEP